MCFSPTVYWGNEFSDLNLIQELKKEFDVSYAVKSHKMFINYRLQEVKKKIFILYKIFSKKIYDDECGFPGFDEKYKKNDRFINAKTIWIESWSILKKLIKENDIIVLGSYRNNQWLVEYSRLNNKVVLIHKNPANLDFETGIMPNIFCLKDHLDEKNVTNLINLKKIKKISNDEIIEVTGSLQHQLTNMEFLEKEKFFKKYNLDINKKLFLFLPCAPQHHNKKYREDYVEICKKISKNYNLLIKGHPTDYAKRKLINKYKGKSSWEYLLPNYKICDPHDFNDALKCCDAAISIFSTVFNDVNKMGVPIIFVNRFDNFAYNILGEERKIGKDVYESLIDTKIYELTNKFLDEVKKYYNEDINKNEFILASPELTSKLYKFYGCDISLDDLDDFLNKNEFNKFRRLAQNNGDVSKKIKDAINFYIKKNYHKKNILKTLKTYILIKLFKYQKN